MISKQFNSKGFTLIELLISISLLGALLFTGSYTYSLMSERWNKELGSFNSSARIAKNLELLQRALEGVSPFIVIDEKKTPSFFFIGSENSLLAVTRAGMFSNEYPEVFRISTLKNNKGSFDLVYQSISTANILLLGINQEINFTHKIILLKGLNSVQFEYFGWENLKGKRDGIGFEKWFVKYSGIDSQLTPQKMKVKLMKNGNAIQFPIHLELNPERWLGFYMEEIE